MARGSSLQSARAWNSVIVRNSNNNRTELPENSKRRRKNMVERNLLKTTLMKNYKLDKAKSEARIAKFVEKKRRELLFPQFS